MWALGKRRLARQAGRDASQASLASSEVVGVEGSRLRERSAENSFLPASHFLLRLSLLSRPSLPFHPTVRGSLGSGPGRVVYRAYGV